MAYQPFNDFIGGSNQRSPVYQNSEYTQNLYYESAEAGATPRAPGQLLSTPGLQSRTYLNTSETGPVLALATVSGATLTGNVTQPTTFAVIGRTNAYGTPGLYRFNNNLTSPTFISPLPFGSSSSHFFRIIPGNTALMVIDITSPQAYGYTYNYSVGGPGGGAIGPNGVLQPGFDFTPGVYSSQPGWQYTVDGDYTDGYFVFGQAASENWFISGLENPNLFNALDFAVESDIPDTITAVRAMNGRVWIFGRTRMVAWYNSGAAGFPFTRDNSSRIDIGAVNAACMAKLNNTLFWLGRDANGGVQAYQLSGYQPQRISTAAQEQIWQGYASVDNAYAWAYQEEGHPFYLVFFPTAGTCYAFDAKEGRWHQRALTIAGVNQIPASQVHTFNPLLGGHIVGDRGSGNCSVMSRAYTTDLAVPIVRRRTAPHLFSGLNRSFYSRFVLDTNTSQAQLSYSNDYGTTFNTPRSPDIAGNGKSEWVRLGSAQTDRVFSVQITDTTNPVVVSAAYLDAEGSL
jgi:hypothetical protein